MTPDSVSCKADEDSNPSLPGASSFSPLSVLQPPPKLRVTPGWAVTNTTCASPNFNNHYQHLRFILCAGIIFIHMPPCVFLYTRLHTYISKHTHRVFHFCKIS